MKSFVILGLLAGLCIASAADAAPRSRLIEQGITDIRLHEGTVLATAPGRLVLVNAATERPQVVEGIPTDSELGWIAVRGGIYQVRQVSSDDNYEIWYEIWYISLPEGATDVIHRYRWRRFSYDPTVLIPRMVYAEREDALFLLAPELSPPSYYGNYAVIRIPPGDTWSHQEIGPWDEWGSPALAVAEGYVYCALNSGLLRIEIGSERVGAQFLWSHIGEYGRNLLTPGPKPWLVLTIERPDDSRIAPFHRLCRGTDGTVFREKWRQLHIDPDGTRAVGLDAAGAVYRIDLPAGTTAPLLPARQGRIRCGVSWERDVVVAQGANPGMLAAPLDGSAPVALAGTPSSNNFTITDNGTVLFHDTVSSVPLSGGQPTSYRPGIAIYPGPTPDQVLVCNPEGGQFRLDWCPVGGGAMVPVSDAHPNFEKLIFAEDGRKVFFLSENILYAADITPSVDPQVIVADSIVRESLASAGSDRSQDGVVDCADVVGQ